MLYVLLSYFNSSQVTVKSRNPKLGLQAHNNYGNGSLINIHFIIVSNSTPFQPLFFLCVVSVYQFVATVVLVECPLSSLEQTENGGFVSPGPLCHLPAWAVLILRGYNGQGETCYRRSELDSKCVGESCMLPPRQTQLTAATFNAL